MTSDARPEHIKLVDTEETEVVQPSEQEFQKQLDEDERELREIRVDLPGAAAGSASGLIAVGVGKIPKDEYFRVHPGADFSPVVLMIKHAAGMDTSYCTVTPSMADGLRSIKIYPARYRIYFATTEADLWRLVPVRDGSQNTWDKTLTISLHRAMTEWVRIYNDPDKRDEGEGWKSFPAAPGRFPDPVWPDLSIAKLMRLGFKDRGNRIDSPDHPLVKKWAAGHGI